MIYIIYISYVYHIYQYTIYTIYILEILGENGEPEIGGGGVRVGFRQKKIDIRPEENTWQKFRHKRG